jgi:BirA family biotin operon repressor/biotin-[acetyl-CoA-carboxylase] ligase
MEEAARIAPGLGGPEWVLGLRQTKGRGRRGRPWADPGGNFSATLVLWPEGDAGQVALRSFVAALALHEACVEVTGQAERFTLKWPNDVLLNGGKLAGILLERAAMPGARAPLLIGIGVNLAACPPVDAVEPGGLRPVSLKAETGVEIAPEAFLVPLARAFAKWEAQFATHGFAPIRRAWLSHAARLGERSPRGPAPPPTGGGSRRWTRRAISFYLPPNPVSPFRRRTCFFDRRGARPCSWRLIAAIPTPSFPSGTGRRFCARCAPRPITRARRMPISRGSRR